jgi:tRNA (guanine26-N2/guanine27-N2)-dimethyltransferase
LEFSFPTEPINEGSVEILAPKLKAFIESKADYAPSKSPVFYNPRMEVSRDIAVLAIQCYQRSVDRELKICEPMTGCGIRGIRYAFEVEGVRSVLLNDANPLAAELARYNVVKSGLTGRVEVKCMDANALLSLHSDPRERFNVVDIDPFGSPAPFIGSAVRAIVDGGLLALTATDMASLCGVHPNACFRKYGGKPLRTEYRREIAARLLVGYVASVAAKNDVGVNALFCHATDHYVRVYCELKHGAERANESVEKLGYILHCFNCLNRITLNKIEGASRECDLCGFKYEAAGPLWLGSLFDLGFCEEMIDELEGRNFKEKRRIRSMFEKIRAEAEAPPTYYVVDKICDKYGIPTPPLREIIRGLRERGYAAARTHFHERGVRTNARAVVVNSIVKGLAEESRG